MNKILYIILFLIFSEITVKADQFVPEFNTMKILRCDYKETIYDINNHPLVSNKQFRIYRLDDAYKKIYLQKEPIDYVSEYDSSKIVFSSRSIGFNSFLSTVTTIDRENLTFSSYSDIDYEDEHQPPKIARSEGPCRFLN